MSATARGRDHRAYRRVRLRVLAESDVCWLCGHTGADTVDHLVPLAYGGPLLDPHNLRPAHRSCNSSRGTGAAVVNAPTSRRW